MKRKKFTALQQTPFKCARGSKIDSPLKVARNVGFYSSGDSESSEDGLSDSLEISEELHGSKALNNRLRGMDAHLKFEDGIQPCKIDREGREFVYSSSAMITISGKKLNLNY